MDASPKDEELAGLDPSVDSRFLVVEIDPDGVLSCDPEESGIAPHELPGIGHWIQGLGYELLDGDFEEDERD